MFDILIYLALIPLALYGAILLFELAALAIGIIAMPWVFIYEQIEKLWRNRNERN